MKTMITRKILFILIFAFISLSAMDKPLPPKSNNVELVSSDNKSFTLSLAIAQQSPVLHQMLSQFEEKETKIIKLSLINGATLRLVIKIMELFYQYRELKGKALLDKVVAEYSFVTRLQIPINNRQTLALLRAFDFLEFTPGIQLITRKISTNQFMLDWVMNLIQKKKLSTNTATEIGRIYYLITNKELPDTDKNNFVFSLRDYLDYRPEIIQQRHLKKWELDLSKLHLIDLDGIQDIPNLNNITILNLSHNNLTELLPDLGVIGLNNLTGLYLAHNQLSQLPATFLNGLNKLTFLAFDFNRLFQLPATIFQGLNKLQHLSLQYNQLTELPITLFQDLSDLKDLRLNSNRLTQLPAHLFDGVNNLQELDLSHNKLELLPSTLFKNLSNLREVTFFYNKKLKQLPVQLFQGLNRLQEVDLRVTRLSEENIAELRKAYPNVRIQF